jgi:hypothetical protein
MPGRVQSRSRHERTNDEAARICSMPPRRCVVSVGDPQRVTHSVEVTADTLFEAAAQGVKLLREDGWVEPVGPSTRLVVMVSPPAVRHEVTFLQLKTWSDSTAITPDERVRKNRVRDLLATPITANRPQPPASAPRSALTSSRERSSPHTDRAKHRTR